MIKIITVGNIKENYLREAIEEYKKRLSKYTSLEIIEVKEENEAETNKNIRLEGERIEKYLNEKDYIITLEVEGKELSSLEFADKMDKIQQESSNIVFIIGGSCGLSEDIKKKSQFPLSFSKMTFPHQLFRVILLEQIYRSYKINNHESYHK